MEEIFRNFGSMELSEIIEFFDMKCDYTLNEYNEIVESWSSRDNPFISMIKVYEMNDSNLSKLDKIDRNNILQSLLIKMIDSENYEVAAKLRDKIEKYEN